MTDALPTCMSSWREADGIKVQWCAVHFHEYAACQRNKLQRVLDSKFESIEEVVAAGENYPAFRYWREQVNELNVIIKKLRAGESQGMKTKVRPDGMVNFFNILISEITHGIREEQRRLDETHHDLLMLPFGMLQGFGIEDPKQRAKIHVAFFLFASDDEVKVNTAASALAEAGDMLMGKSEKIMTIEPHERDPVQDPDSEDSDDCEGLN